MKDPAYEKMRDLPGQVVLADRPGGAFYEVEMVLRGVTLALRSEVLFTGPAGQQYHLTRLALVELSDGCGKLQFLAEKFLAGEVLFASYGEMMTFLGGLAAIAADAQERS